MKVLNEEEIPYGTIVDKDGAIKDGFAREKFLEGAKAQRDADKKWMVELLESYTFYDDFGGDSAKDFRDRLVKQLEEKK